MLSITTERTCGGVSGFISFRFHQVSGLKAAGESACLADATSDGGRRALFQQVHVARAGHPTRILRSRRPAPRSDIGMGT